MSGPAQPRKRMGRPPTGQTPKRSIRMGPVWDEAAALAATGGESTTAFVTRALSVEIARVHAQRRALGEKDLVGEAQADV